MERSFWLERWNGGRIAFHRSEPHPALVGHFGRLGVEPGGRVFVPLCGKTVDIPWLLAEGYRVVGVELAEVAVRELFAALGVEPRVASAGSLERYAADGVEIFAGDLFELSASELGAVGAIYDRAALVALPEEMRGRYAARLVGLTGGAPQLLITFEYDQREMEGPPFSVPAGEVRRLYGGSYDLELVERSAVAGGLKGVCAADEVVWRLG